MGGFYTNERQYHGSRISVVRAKSRAMVGTSPDYRSAQTIITTVAMGVGLSESYLPKLVGFRWVFC